METPLVVAGSLAPLVLAIAVVVRPWRRPIGALLLVAAILAAVHGATAEGQLEREVYHLFQGFTDLEPGGVSYTVHDAVAPAGRWGWILAGWLGLTGLVCLVAGGRSDDGHTRSPTHPWGAPLALALGGVATNMLLENAAAPTALVYPVPLERILVPATLAAGVQMARRADRFLPVFFQLSAMLFLIRGIIAVASYQLSTRELGTSLDIHRVTEISNPTNQMYTGLEPHSLEQHAWLIWAPHLFLMPALYMMSVGSLTFCIFQFLKHPPPPRH